MFIGQGHGGGNKQQREEAKSRGEAQARNTLRNRHRYGCCVDPNARKAEFTQDWKVEYPIRKSGTVKETCASLGLHHDARHPSCAVHMNNYCSAGGAPMMRFSATVRALKELQTPPVRVSATRPRLTVRKRRSSNDSTARTTDAGYLFVGILRT
eukprot:6177259-Pleurochrysis_carterae.AAC.1